MYTKATVDDSNICQPKITFSSSAACKKASFSAIWNWINSNKWPLFVIFLVVGLIICFFGRRLFKPMLFLTGLTLVVALTMLIFYSTFLKKNSQDWVGWVVLAGSVVIGSVFGYFLMKMAKVGGFLLAGWGGFALGLLFYNAVLNTTDSQAALWCISIGFALIMGILCLFFFDHILINTTAISGSFLAIQGIGLVAGHYQNPFTLAQDRANGIIDHIDPIFYAYLAANIVVYGLGTYFQYKQKKSDNKTGWEPYHRLR